MSLPDNIKVPSYVKHRTYMGVLMILPATYGVYKMLSSYPPAPTGQFIYGIITVMFSVFLMLLFTECKRLIMKPNVFIQKDDVRTKLYVVDSYPERHWERYTSEDMMWIEVIKLFPWVYIAVGEPFKGSDSPFIRHHKDFN